MKDGSPSALSWEVVESLPVSEDIKKQKGDWRAHVANYKESLRNLASAGIAVVCYNFMPVLDWTRTDLAWRLPNGATCMRFDYVDFAAFDIFILQRRNAAADFPDEISEQARIRHSLHVANRATRVGQKRCLRLARCRRQSDAGRRAPTPS